MIILWNKQKGTGGAGKGASFPTVVTDSGSSLPLASGYIEGDTFLNTTDKKIYKTVVNGYILSSNYTNNATLDLETGIASNFSVGQYSAPLCVLSSTVQMDWTGNLTFNIHFRINSEPLDTNDHAIFETYKGGNGYYKGFVISIKNKKLYLYLTQQRQSPAGIYKSNLLADYELSEEVEYYLSITKSDTICSSSLSIGGYGTNIIASNSFETENWVETSHYGTVIQRYGGSVYFGAFSFGQIYLGDTTGNAVIPNTSTLSWDSGTSLTDKTEYADKTNGKLYLYENDNLVTIGGSSNAPTVLTDQTSTSMALAGNTIYKWTSALTSLSFSSAEVSDLETVLYFTTGGTISFTDSSGVRWGGGNEQPTLEANTVYCIAIRNGLAEIDSFGSAS